MSNTIKIGKEVKMYDDKEFVEVEITKEGILIFTDGFSFLPIPKNKTGG